MVNKRTKKWSEVPLIDILISLENGSRPKGGVQDIKAGVPSIGAEHLDSKGFFNFSKVKYIPKEFAAKLSRGQVKINDILIVKDGATTGKTSFIDKDFPYKKAFVNEHVFICRSSKNIDSKFLFWFLWSGEGQERILKNFKGSAQGGINQTFAPNTMVPIAPIQEQKRISSKLDVLFKNIYSIQSKLDEFPNIISELRQQILYQAITGQFTKDWRVKNGVKKRWQNVKLIDHSIKIGSGATPRGGQSVYITKGIPLIRSMNVHFKGFKYDGLVFINKKQADELKNVTVKSGDVLLNITGASIGRVCQAPSNMNGARVNQHVCIIRTKNTIVQSFLNYFLASPKMQQYIDSENYGVTRQALTKIMIEDFEIPLPGKKEQNEIVKRIRKIFNQINKIESKHNSLLTFIEEFRNSVLESAYTGKLVPQNPKDEPVEKLLERIQKEKLYQQKTPCFKRQGVLSLQTKKIT